MAIWLIQTSEFSRSTKSSPQVSFIHNFKLLFSNRHSRQSGRGRISDVRDRDHWGRPIVPVTRRSGIRAQSRGLSDLRPSEIISLSALETPTSKGFRRKVGFAYSHFRVSHLKMVLSSRGLNGTRFGIVHHLHRFFFRLRLTY
jgi:hypothetical protein